MVLRPGAVAVVALVGASMVTSLAPACRAADGLRVGASAVVIEADDSMVIAGSILGGHAKGQEGLLRATAVVLEKPARTKIAIVSCDVLFVQRDFVDPALQEIARKTGIPTSHILVSATHTHHAPSVTDVHGYVRDTVFTDRLRRAIVRAVVEADRHLEDGMTFRFAQGEEKTIGQNSRLLLEDGRIFWIGPRGDAVRPTGPFDPQLPVLAFQNAQGRLAAMIYNHSTHTIGTRRGNVRSPGFYGLAAQELEAELGGTIAFLEGASGSTHNLTVPAAEAVKRLKIAIRQTLERAAPQPVDRVEAIKRPFTFRVRRFDEQREDEKVASYCRKRAPASADSTIEVFRKMRRRLAPQQGRERSTWLQVMRIGDVAIVGVPAEYFTSLGIDIKKRSPFPHTYIAELANDWIGYLPDREGHRLGGYQTWMGLHSYAEVGTGERMADAAVAMLNELRRSKTPTP